MTKDNARHTISLALVNLLLCALASSTCSACSSDDKSAHNKDAGGDAATGGAGQDAASSHDASTQHDASVPSDAGASNLDAAATSDAQVGSDAAGPEADASADSGVGPVAQICVKGASYGAPLSATTVAATKLQDGFAFTEGPVWIGNDTLLFSDVQAATGPENVQPSKIRSLVFATKTFDLWLDDSGSNGMALWPDGSQIVACTHDMQSVSRYRLSDKQRSTLVGDYTGKKFHSPNDVTVRSDGTVYFTDPDFQQGNRNTNIVGPTAVYRVPPGGAAIVVDDTMSNPNGIALSPDEKTLYVDGDGSNVVTFAIAADGSTSGRAPFVSGLDAPDGMSMDCAGNLYVAEYNTGTIHVYASDKTPLGTITTTKNVTNMAFGGSDHQTLFITATGDQSSAIYTLHTNVPGLPY